MGYTPRNKVDNPHAEGEKSYWVREADIHTYILMSGVAGFIVGVLFTVLVGLITSPSEPEVEDIYADDRKVDLR